MPKSTVERYLAGLADDTLLYVHRVTGERVTVADRWVERLQRARQATVEGVAAGLLDGAPLVLRVLPRVVGLHQVRQTIRAQVADPVAALTDRSASLQRVLLVAAAHNWYFHPRGAHYGVFRRVFRSRLKAGLVPEPDSLLWLVNWVIDDDWKFGVDVLAHTTHVGPGRSPGDDEMFSELMVNIGLKQWDRALKRRERLCAGRWLRGQIGETAWAETRDITPALLRGLYPRVWEQGYAGYRRAVTAG